MEKRASRDIEETGNVPLEIVGDIGMTLEVPVEHCLGCSAATRKSRNAPMTVEKEGSYL